MNNSIFPDWEKTIRDNKEIFLNSIIDRYGEENRELLSRRYDETKVCFFETYTRLLDYIDTQSKKEMILESFEFLKKIGIDTSSIYEDEDGLTSNDPEVEKKLKCLFGPQKRLSVENTPIAMISLSNTFGTGAMLSFDYQMINFLIRYNLQDYEMYKDNPEEIKAKYLSMSFVAKTHVLRGTKSYKQLIDYMNLLKAKEIKVFDEYMRNFEKNIHNLGENHSLINLVSYEMDDYILNNFDYQKIPLDVRKQFVSLMRHSNANFTYENLVFLSPYFLKSYSFDIVYDHEFTHALESFTYTLPNGCKVNKCGIRETIYDKNYKIIKIKNNNINEAITQLLTVESTLKRYSNKQFIFEDPKEDISKIGVSTCKYDKNLPKARVLVDALPREFITRRIESTIDFIYEYFDEKTWDEIDAKIDDDNISLEEFTNYINEKRCVRL